MGVTLISSLVATPFVMGYVWSRWKYNRRQASVAKGKRRRENRKSLQTTQVNGVINLAVFLLEAVQCNFCTGGSKQKTIQTEDARPKRSTGLPPPAVPSAPQMAIKKLEDQSSSSSSVDNHKPSSKMRKYVWCFIVICTSNCVVFTLFSGMMRAHQIQRVQLQAEETAALCGVQLHRDPLLVLQ